MKTFFSFILALTIIKASAQTTLLAKDAAKHIGEKVTICDKVFGARHFGGGTELTLLNIGGMHPNELLTVVIKGDDLKKFKSAPEEEFKDKKICITGTLVDYKGKPEIIVTDPEQIKAAQ